MNRLDPHAPLVLDTRELGRRAGAMRRLDLTVPAPGELGTPVVGVPEGTDMRLELRLESVIEGVLVSGTVRVHTVGECSRCLDPVVHDVVVDLQELYTHPQDDDRGRGPRDEDDDDALPEMVGDFLDLEPTLRDAVVLALPLAPVCRDDCPGLCVECGARWADEPDHQHDAADPRWAALAGLSRPADPHDDDRHDPHDDERHAMPDQDEKEEG